jgi:hypothetical protein
VPMVPGAGRSAARRHFAPPSRKVPCPRHPSSWDGGTEILMGRPAIWAGPIGRDLVVAVIAELEAAGLSRTDRNAVRMVCARLVRRAPWRKHSEGALLRGYYRAREQHGDKPKLQRRKIPARIKPGVPGSWLGAIRMLLRKLPPDDKQRVTYRRALMMTEFCLREVTDGHWPEVDDRKMRDGRWPFGKYTGMVERAEALKRSAKAVEQLKQVARQAGRRGQ